MDIRLPYQFDPTKRQWQLDVLSDPRRNKVLVIPRRHGKTALAINKLILEAFKPENKNKIFHYVCPTITQAKDNVWTPPDMIKAFLPNELIAKKNEVERIIYLINGAQIHVKGADNPDSLRGGNPYGVILDEAATMKSEVYDEIYLPIIAENGGWIWIIGTPKGKNWFHKKYMNAVDSPARWHVMHLRADEAGVLSQDILQQSQSEMTQAAYTQEFLTEFLEGEGTIFRRIVENVFGQFEEPRLGHQYKIGVDLARHKDWTVVTVIDRATHHMVYFDRFNQVDWNLQKARIEAIARRYNMATITIDATGVGEPVCEDLRRTGLIVNDFKFTSESKKSLIENLALYIEQNKMTYPNVPELISELEAYTYELSSHGNVRYTAPEGQHDDGVCSLALAMWQIGPKLIMNNLSSKPTYATAFNLRAGGYSKPIYSPPRI